MSREIGAVVCSVILTLLAALLGGWISDFQGNLSLIFAVTAMGGCVIYAILSGRNRGGKAAERKDADKDDKPQA